MFKFLNNFLITRKKNLPLDDVAHLLAVRMLLSIIEVWGGKNKILQLSDLGYLLEELDSRKLQSPAGLKRLGREYFLFIHSPSLKLLEEIMLFQNKPDTVCLLLHNYFSLDHLLSILGFHFGISSSDPARFLRFREVKNIFDSNGYSLVFDEGSFFSSKMALALLPKSFQMKFGKLLIAFENSKKARIFRSLLKPFSRNRFLVFKKDVYFIKGKRRIGREYLGATLGFDKKYNKKTFYGKFYLENVNRLMKVSNPKSSDRVLDIGTGTGTFAIEAAKRGCRIVYGVDISSDMIKIAKNKVARLGLKDKIKFVVADAENLPFKSNYFDVIYSASVPHDVDDFSKYLGEIARVLRKNGLAYINIFNFFTPAGLIHLIRMCFFDSTKLNVITRRRLIRESIKVGLEVSYRFGIELMQGLPIPWSLRWVIYKKFKRYDEKLSFSRFNFIYSQFFYCLRKIC